MSCAQIRELEERLIRELGVPGLLLMENAALAVAEVAFGLLSDVRSPQVTILVGPGNNGGDGLATARLMMTAGINATAVLATAGEKLHGDAATNLNIYRAVGGRPWELGDTDASRQQLWRQLESSHIIIDALLGSGASGKPRGTIAQMIRLANAASVRHKLAVDIPSGLAADTGKVSAPCFVATVTVTFVAEKLGFSAATAHRVLGAVVVAPIGVPLPAD